MTSKRNEVLACKHLCACIKQWRQEGYSSEQIGKMANREASDIATAVNLSYDKLTHFAARVVWGEHSGVA